MHIVGALHDGNVDGLVAAAGIDIGDGLGFLGSVEVGGGFVEDIVEFGEEFLEGCQDGAQVENEHAGIPDKVPAFEKELCQAQVRLFQKCLDLVEGLLFAVGIKILDVAIACFRACGPDPQGHDDIFLAAFIQPNLHILAEIDGILDQIVRPGHEDAGVRIALADLEGSVGNAGGGIAAIRLQENLGICGRGQMLLDQGQVALIGHDQDIPFGDIIQEAVVGHLEHGLAHAQDVVELLRESVPAHRPKPASNASGHDDHKIVLSHNSTHCACKTPHWSKVAT